MRRMLLPLALVWAPLLAAPAPTPTPTEDVHYDCNGNGVEDAIDIANGSSSDLDCDGVPDECAL